MGIPSRHGALISADAVPHAAKLVPASSRRCPGAGEQGASPWLSPRHDGRSVNPALIEAFLIKARQAVAISGYGTKLPVRELDLISALDG
jgi:hypothetical protein